MKGMRAVTLQLTTQTKAYVKRIGRVCWLKHLCPYLRSKLWSNGSLEGLL